MTFAKKTCAPVMVVLRLQGQTALQWTNPNASLAAVVARWSEILVKKTNALVPMVSDQPEQSALRMVILNAPLATLTIS